MSSTFRYFAYGSNLLKERIHINNPSAEFIGVALLKNYKLAFGNCKRVLQHHKSNSHWGDGGVATILKSEGDNVWGSVWKINMDHMAALDSQEGVSERYYDPLEVVVHTLDNDELVCRTYQQTECELCDPTPQYLSVVQDGAKQSGLPNTYLSFLMSIKHNNYQGESSIYQQVQEKKLDGLKE
ncbi:gamma-glutamylcyclotransferase-like [Saccoglossus kowalevskii]|uniref:gamma-glutamylcyclotransferase n=1 Tax=Saccoglossus kowalevskii TaxID=10224 RepID=A0ABM0GTJ1_SACKO|nr:PREDICTED: gamma-glutamylcyclotransferase-like [Saccoglossus kowalevskii]